MYLLIFFFFLLLNLSFLSCHGSDGGGGGCPFFSFFFKQSGQGPKLRASSLTLDRSPSYVTPHLLITPSSSSFLFFFMLAPSMSHFTDAALATRHEHEAGARGGEGGEKPGAGESERQINASPVLQCIRTRITAVTAAPASPLTEKNYKYYHLHH